MNKKNPSLNECKLFNLPTKIDQRGSLCFIEPFREINFEIKRVYYIYDVPGGAERGGHAHKKLHQLIIAAAGSFDVHLDDGVDKKTFRLDRSFYGLYVCNMIWREINNFSSNSLCLVLASDIYDESDYYRDYNEFVNNAHIKGGL